MAVIVSMLRGVNVGGHHRISMEALRNVCKSLRLRDAQTYVQSGNVVFRSEAGNLASLARRIENGIEREFGFRAAVILRTLPEMRAVVASNPFASRSGIEPGKLLVTFLAAAPAAEACEQVRKIKASPEELFLAGRELYIYFPEGMARSKFPMAAIERALKIPATARNWNSITRLLEMAEQMENTK